MLLVMGYSSLAIERTNSESVSYRVKTFAVAGKLLRIESYYPRAMHASPAIIMVHGSLGIRNCDSTRITPPDRDNFGEREFVEHGYAVAVVHYMDVSDSSTALSRAYEFEHAEQWLSVLSLSLSLVRHDPLVDPSHIYMFGESLGGILALISASQDSGVKAVAVYGADIPPTPLFVASRIPPVLTFSGEFDSILPRGSTRLCRLLTTNKSRCHAEILKGSGHYLSAKTQGYIVRRSALFFSTLR